MLFLLALGPQNSFYCPTPDPSQLLDTPGQPHPLEVMYDVCRVPTTKLGHRDINTLIVLLKIDLHILLQLQPGPDLGGQGVFVEHTTVEEVVSSQLHKVRGETDSHTGW